MEATSLQAMNNNVKFDDVYVDRKRKYDGEKHTCVLIVFASLAILTIGASLLLWATNFIDYLIFKNMVLIEGTEVFKNWEQPPLHPTMYIRIFNYTNVNEFLAGKEKKLRVQEIGPYAYRRKLKRVNVKVNDNGTITFQDNVSFEFIPERTKGNLTDRIVVPNIPVLTAVSQMKNTSLFITVPMSIGMTLMKMYPFLTLEVNDFFWGYEHPLVNVAKVLRPGEPIPPLGILAAKNGTSPNILTIDAGKSNFSRRGVIQRLNGMSALNIWNSEECNRIDSSDGFMFENYITHSTKLHFFNPDLCRKFPLVYVKDAVVQTIPGYRFELPDNMFADIEKNAANTCYCTHYPECPVNGLFDASPCVHGAPVMMSYPHFYKGDPSLVEAVEGLKPIAEDHEFYMIFQQKMGVVLRANTRLQMNIVARKVDGIRRLNILENDIVLPVVWMETITEEFPPSMVSNIRFAVIVTDRIAYALILGLLCCGLIFLCLFLWFVHKRRRKVAQYDGQQAEKLKLQQR